MKILFGLLLINLSFQSGAMAAVNPDSLLIQARSAETTGNIPKAISLYQQCLKFPGVREDALTRASLLMLGQNNINDAQSMLEDFLTDQDVFSVSARLALAQVFQKKGDLTRALAEIEKAEGLRANNIEAFRLKARFLYEAANYPDAITVATKALKFDEKDEATRFVRASALFAQKKFKESLVDLLEISTKNPISPDALRLQAEAYYQLVDFPKARVSWESLLKLNPQSIPVLEKLGDLHAQLNNVDSSIEYYKKAIAIEPRLVAVRTKLGNAYALKGLKEKARSEYEQALSFDSSYDAAQYRYVKIFLDEGRSDEAGRTLKTWFKEFPEKTWLASAYAKFYL